MRARAATRRDVTGWRALWRWGVALALLAGWCGGVLAHGPAALAATGSPGCQALNRITGLRTSAYSLHGASFVAGERIAGTAAAPDSGAPTGFQIVRDGVMGAGTGTLVADVPYPGTASYTVPATGIIDDLRFQVVPVAEANATLTLACLPAPRLVPAPVSGTYGGTATLSAAFTDGAGGPIVGRTIAFTLDDVAACGVGGTPPCPATGGDGVATLAGGSLAGHAVGTRPDGAGASFAGDGIYVATSGTAALTVTAPVAVTPQSIVIASATGSGTISPNGASRFATGSQASYTAVPTAGHVFVGWTLDGVPVGYASPLTFTVSTDRTLVATFAARPTFADVPTTDPDYQAITTFAALGIVNPDGVNGSGQFQPDRTAVRAEVAALLVRAFGWERESHGNSFPDKCDPRGADCVDDRLWNDVAALQDYGVVGGYADSATCAASGTIAPCYLPRDPVLRLQVVSIVARAFTKAPGLRPNGYWDRLAAVAGQYTNVPDSGTQRGDLATYRQNAGVIPGQASDGTFPQPTGVATRRFVIATLWQAYNAQFGIDRVP